LKVKKKKSNFGKRALLPNTVGNDLIKNTNPQAYLVYLTNLFMMARHVVQTLQIKIYTYDTTEMYNLYSKKFKNICIFIISFSMRLIT
jgi:hypothetical protein